MGLRFRKSVTLCKGLKLNFGKNGMSVSVGRNGLRKTFHTFSIYQVLPQLIELWGLNVQTDVSAKKKFVQQIAR